MYFYNENRVNTEEMNKNDWDNEQRRKNCNISILYTVSICQVSRYFILCTVFNVLKKGLKHEECLRHTQYFEENANW